MVEKAKKRGRPLIHGKDAVKFIFRDTALRKTSLRIKLKEDKFSLSKFFHKCITAYLEDDPNILRALGLTSGEHLRPKISQIKIEKEAKKADSIKRDFGLDGADLEKLYDLIEQGMDV